MKNSGNRRPQCRNHGGYCARFDVTTGPAAHSYRLSENLWPEQMTGAAADPTDPPPPSALLARPDLTARPREV